MLFHASCSSMAPPMLFHGSSNALPCHVLLSVSPPMLFMASSYALLCLIPPSMSLSMVFSFLLPCPPCPLICYLWSPHILFHVSSHLTCLILFSSFLLPRPSVSPSTLFMVSSYALLCHILPSMSLSTVFSFLLTCSYVFPLLLCYLWSPSIHFHVLLHALPVHIHFTMFPVSYSLLTYSSMPHLIFFCLSSNFLLYLFALFHVSSCTILFYSILFCMSNNISNASSYVLLCLSLLTASLHGHGLPPRELFRF